MNIEEDIIYDGNPLVIDNFLFDEELKRLQDKIIFNLDFTFYYEIINQNNSWDWYGSNVIYQEDRRGYDIELYNMIWKIFAPKINFQKLMRIEVNFHPHTATILEHASHINYNFSHAGAIFLLNTCDGFTRIGDEKISSVQNRMMFFDASKSHYSSTTSNARGRFFINFNFI